MVLRMELVHTVATADIFKRVKQIVQKLVVHRIAVVFVFFQNLYAHVATRCAAFVLVTQMMPAASLDVFGENFEWQKTQIFHGRVYLFDNSPINHP